MTSERRPISRRRMLAITGLAAVTLAGCTDAGGPEVDYSGGENLDGEGDRERDEGADNEEDGDSSLLGGNDADGAIPGFDAEGFRDDIDSELEAINEEVEDFTLEIDVQSLSMDGGDAICEYEFPGGPAGPELMVLVASLFADNIVDEDEFESAAERAVFVVRMTEADGEGFVYDFEASAMVAYRNGELNDEEFGEEIQDVEPIEETDYE